MLVGRVLQGERGMSPHRVFDDAVLLVRIYMQCQFQCGGETKAILLWNFKDKYILKR